MRRDRGTALILTTIIIFMMVGLTFAFIAIPEATRKQVTTSVAYENALQIADAGVRDAIKWRMSHDDSDPAWDTGVTPNRKLSTDGNVLTWTQWGDPTGRSMSAFKWVMTIEGGAFYKIIVQGRSQLSISKATTDADRYMEAQIEVWLERAPVIIPDFGTTTFASPSTQVTVGNFWINTNPGTGADFWVPQVPKKVFFEQNGGTPAPTAINGGDAASTGYYPGATFKDPNMAYGEGFDQVTGSSPVFQRSANPNTWDTITKLVEEMKAKHNDGTVTNGHAGYQTDRFISATYAMGKGDGGKGGGTWSGPMSSFSNCMVYIKLPSRAETGGVGMTMDGAILDLDGKSGNSSGVLVLDVGDDFSFSPGTAPLYIKAGTGWFQGAIVFYQRGNIYVYNTNIYESDGKTGKAGMDGITGDDDGLYLIKKMGSNSNFVQYNSVAIKEAFRNFSTSFSIVSYRTLRKTNRNVE